MPIPFERRDSVLDTASPEFGRGARVPGHRDWSTEATAERIAFVQERVGPIPWLTGGQTCRDSAFYRGNIENFVGLTTVPTGIVGPLRVRGEHARGDCYLPLATTEGALVASYNRGAAVTAAAGGIVSVVGGQSVHRAPVFAFDAVADAIRFASWIEGEEDRFKSLTVGCSRHGRLTGVRIHLEANLVYLIFSYRTGDAAGQNMVTLCTDAICREILGQTPVQPRYWFLESNLSGDKKATFLSFLAGRGWTATAEVILPDQLVRERLRTTPTQMVRFWETGTVAAIQAGSIGVSGHIANGLAALFLACGQDVACVSEASVGVTRFELTDRGDLRCTITMPNLIVGTVGGGTRMPTARECLRIAGCEGAGSAPRLAELCAALSLAGEISISAALCSGDFAAAHAAYGRPSKRAPTKGPVRAVVVEADIAASALPSPAGVNGTAANRGAAVHRRPESADRPGIAARAAFDRIRYSSVWEDADVLCEALEPAVVGRRILSIASAGDNVLALLTLDPSEVVAVDLSSAQLACLELRMAAFRELDHASLLGFLGFAPHADRHRTYLRLRQHLSAGARTVWDGRRQAILAGPALAGRFERYLSLFRNWVVPLAHGKRRVAALISRRTEGEQRRFYDRVWNNRRWRLISRLFFSRLVMGRYGRDPAFFEQVSDDVGAELFKRNERFLRSTRVSDNPYLTLLLTGSFQGALPRYLRPEHHEVIRRRLSRVRLVNGGIEEARGAFHGFNLSDIFEYMRPGEHEAAANQVLDAAAPGARVAYWELFVDRPLDTHGARASELRDIGGALTDRSHTWFYDRLRVWEAAR
jgi:hydroxymethylglutaryl-CoA reductase (NADPH)